VLSAAFGVPAFPVDTHIHRLALRWGLSPANSAVDRVERDLRALFPQEQWGTLHLQLIYFGRCVQTLLFVESDFDFLSALVLCSIVAITVLC
jgi:endonuclease III